MAMATFTVTRVLVPVDFSEPSEAAIACATTLAQQFGARVDLLHVIDDPMMLGSWEGDLERPERRMVLEDLSSSARHRLESQARDLSGRGLDVRIHVRPGRAVPAILEMAAEAASDLIIMGTHGRSGVAHLLMGSVAEQIVRAAPCPVLSVGRLRAAVEETVPLPLGLAIPAQ